MPIYARISNGVVAEMLTLDGPIAGRFHPSLTWIDVSGKNVRTGWLAKDGTFTEPPEPIAALVLPSLASVQAQLAELSAQVERLRHAP
jgi:hypothetical protein